MYSLIWVGWVLVELFVENHQILRFSGRDWIFFVNAVILMNGNVVRY